MSFTVVEWILQKSSLRDCIDMETFFTAKKITVTWRNITSIQRHLTKRYASIKYFPHVEIKESWFLPSRSATISISTSRLLPVTYTPCILILKRLRSARPPPLPIPYIDRSHTVSYSIFQGIRYVVWIYLHMKRMMWCHVILAFKINIIITSISKIIILFLLTVSALTFSDIYSRKGTVNNHIQNAVLHLKPF